MASNTKKVAIVTGANKGIGLAVVKLLSKKFEGDIILTARSLDKGKQAVKDLEEAGYENVIFQYLDVTKEESVVELSHYIKSNYEAIDILINNAGIGILNNPENEKIPFGDRIADTVNVNFFGIYKVCKILFPLLSANARVTHVICGGGHLAYIRKEYLRKIMAMTDLTVKVLHRIMQKYTIIEPLTLESAILDGWHESSYCVSKIAVCTLTRNQQKILSDDPKTAGISVNAVNPGYTDTDLTKNSRSSVLHMSKKKQTPDEAADVVVYVATEANTKGQIYWPNKQPVDWTSACPPDEIIVDFL